MKNQICDFGVKLLSIRQSRGMSQLDLGKATRLHTTQISHIENGNRKPSIDNLKILCEALKVSSDYLIGIEDGNKDIQRYEDINFLLDRLDCRSLKLVKDFIRLLIENNLSI